MMKHRYTLHEPIAALATPHGQSALCILRLSGEKIGILAPQFFSAADRMQARCMTYGYFVDENKLALDEVMAVFFPAPHSYTGEDVVEIYAHGNMHLAQRLLERLFQMGFRSALPGEFTYRAVLNGKMDMIKAEAVHELISARSSRGLDHALSRLKGDLMLLLEPIYRRLLQIASFLRMHLDYPEDEVEPLPDFNLNSEMENLSRLLRNSENLERWTQGAVVIIAGRPNVGKSSLFNLLLQKDRALVSDTAGTTRDYLEADIQLNGFPIRLIDTAGLHHSEDEIETLGMQKSLTLFDEADLIIHLTDVTRTDPLPHLDAYQDKVLKVVNKIDLTDVPQNCLAISVLYQKGIIELINHILDKLDFETAVCRNESLMLGSLRQRDLCREALQHIRSFCGAQTHGDLDAMSFHIQQACSCMCELTGKNPDHEINTEMFSRFCLGK